MKLPRRKFLHLTAGAATLLAFPRIVRAQAYPSRPVHIIVGLAAGSAGDIMARLIGQSLSERLGKPFVIENRTGAGGSLAAEAVARASPDGTPSNVPGGYYAAQAAAVAPVSPYSPHRPSREEPWWPYVARGL